MTWIHRAATLAFASFFLPFSASTQVTANPPLRFELASVKPTRPNDPNSNINFNEGQVTAENVNLAFVLKEAFDVNIGSDDQILGAPAWIRTSAFDIKTRIDDTTANTIKQMPLEEQQKVTHAMLRTLLEERFNLKAHTVYEPRTVDSLIVAKSGSKLQPFSVCDASSKEHPCQSDFQGLHNDGHGHIQGQGATLALLANILAMQPDIGGRMVVDNTGLNGEYNFDLHYTPDSAAAENSGPSLFSALGEQLGLKLETKKLPIKVLVIEQLDHPSLD